MKEWINYELYWLLDVWANSLISIAMFHKQTAGKQNKLHGLETATTYKIIQSNNIQVPKNDQTKQMHLLQGLLCGIAWIVEVLLLLCPPL